MLTTMQKKKPAQMNGFCEAVMYDFKKIKEAVTAKDAALAYGVEMNKSDMALCLFHNERNPSMKIGNFFYCFGCGKSGDCIDIVAALFDISKTEAAEKIVEDFNLDEDYYSM